MKRLALKLCQRRIQTRLVAHRGFSSHKEAGVDSKIEHIPSMKEFMRDQSSSAAIEEEEILPEYLHVEREENRGKTYFIETHGCQMNVADSEIVETVLDSSGYTPALDAESADILLLNTCAIREGAE